MDFKNEFLSIMLGDCLERMKEIPDNSVDLILTDPPYAKTQNKWDTIIPFEPMWKELERISKPNTAIILFGQNTFTFKLGLSNEKLFRYTLVWEKSKAGGFLNARRMPLQAHEDILIFYKKLPVYNPQMEIGMPYVKKAISDGDGGNYGKFTRAGSINENNGERFPRSVLKFSNPNNKTIHKTQKPVDLLEWIIKTYSNPGDTVLDFTAGSFSTGKASLNTHRFFIGIEKDYDMYDEVSLGLLEHLSIMEKNHDK